MDILCGTLGKAAGFTNVNHVNNNGDNVLSLAVVVCKYHPNRISKLMSLECTHNNIGRTPLHIAVYNKNLSMVTFLLDNNKSFIDCIMHQDLFGNTPLHLVCDNHSKNGSKDDDLFTNSKIELCYNLANPVLGILKMIIAITSKNQDVLLVKNNKGFTCLDIICFQRSHFLKHLIHLESSYLITLLSENCKKKNNNNVVGNVIGNILENLTDVNGRTIFYYASQNNNSKLCKLLVECGIVEKTGKKTAVCKLKEHKGISLLRRDTVLSRARFGLLISRKLLKVQQLNVVPANPILENLK